MAVKDKGNDVSEEFEWSVDAEVQLFYAMNGHKPVGINKYFQMACIVEKFRSSINKDVSSKVIWEHLDTMYDLQALDESELLPFPNEEKDFCLPDSDFADIIKEKIKVGVKEPKETKDKDSKETKEIKKEGKEAKRENKDSKENKRDNKETKEVKREGKDVKDSKKENKEVKKEPKEKESKKESRDTKESKKEPKTEKEGKGSKAKSKDKEEIEKDEVMVSSRKDRTKETRDSERNEETPKRGTKRATRGSIKDDTGSKSSSPITTPPSKRRRT